MLQLATHLGLEGDATPFTSLTVEQVADRLHKLGYQRSGNEVMYNGHTGRKMVANYFLGPTYYQVRCTNRGNVGCVFTACDCVTAFEAHGG